MSRFSVASGLQPATDLGLDHLASSTRVLDIKGSLSPIRVIQCQGPQEGIRWGFRGNAGERKHPRCFSASAITTGVGQENLGLGGCRPSCRGLGNRPTPGPQEGATHAAWSRGWGAPVERIPAWGTAGLRCPWQGTELPQAAPSEVSAFLWRKATALAPRLSKVPRSRHLRGPPHKIEPRACLSRSLCLVDALWSQRPLRARAFCVCVSASVLSEERCCHSRSWLEP